jgi:hypothetical protein
MYDYLRAIEEQLMRPACSPTRGLPLEGVHQARSLMELPPELETARFKRAHNLRLRPFYRSKVETQKDANGATHSPPAKLHVLKYLLFDELEQLPCQGIGRNRFGVARK